MKRSRNFLVLLLLSMLLSLSFVMGAAAQTAGFSDLSAIDSNNAFISYLAERGILSGFPDGSFRPDNGLSRAQAALVMVRAAGLDVDEFKVAEFSDVATTHWASGSIAAAAQAGYIKGFPDGTFQPEEELTRAQGISLILHLSGQTEQAAIPLLSDVTADHWAAADIATGLAAGMVGLSADGKSFLPDAPFTRAELARALGILLTRDVARYQTVLEGELLVSAGSVIIEKSDKSKIEIKEKATIKAGDTIISGAGVKSELNFPDGSSLLIKENTRISFREGKGRSYIKSDGMEGTAVDWLNMYLEKGSVLAALATDHYVQKPENNTIDISRNSISNKLLASLDAAPYLAETANIKSLPWWEASAEKKVKMKVDMPWGVVAVRGTFISVTVDEDGKSNVSCLIGDAEISGKGSAGEVTATVSLQGGKSSNISAPNTAPTAPGAMTAQEIQQFNQEKGWIDNTAREIERNQEMLTPPAPPVSLSQEQPAQAVQPPTPQVNIPASMAEAIRNALDSASSNAPPTASTSGTTTTSGGGGGSSDNGSSSSSRIVSLQDSFLIVGIDQDIQMPATVTAVRRNNTEIQLPVTWDNTQPDTSTPGIQEITGTVAGFSGNAILKLIVEYPLGQPLSLNQGQKIYLAGGICLDLGDLVIPEGATLTVSEVSNPPLIPAGLIAGGKIVDITFENISIDQPVILTLPVNNDADHSKAAIYYYDESNQSWEQQYSQIIDGAVEAPVNHFSIYGVLVSQVPTVVALQALDLSVYYGEAATAEPLSLNRDFDSDISKYSASVGTTAQSLQLSFVPADSTSTVQVNGESPVDGSNSIILPLNDENTTIQILVTAADGEMMQTYTLIVSKSAMESVPVIGAVKDIQSQEDIDGANVQVYCGEQMLIETTTMANGQFTLQLAPDCQYLLIISKDGYFTSEQNVNVSGGTTHYLETCYLQLASSETGAISGTIIDALTGHGVEGLTINLRPGMNKTSGPIASTTITTTDGSYELSDLTAGTYTGEVIGSDYTTAYFTIQVIAGQLNPNQNGTVTQPLDSGQTRIVLTWGETPHDLDSHLIVSDADNNSYRVCYYDKSLSLADGTHVADLDLDNTEGYGPETTTIYNQQSDSTYTFYVHNYSARYYPTPTLSDSGAQVKVYRGDILQSTFYVPSGSNCLIWKVFELKNDIITPLNIMSDDYSGAYIYGNDGNKEGAGKAIALDSK